MKAYLIFTVVLAVTLLHSAAGIKKHTRRKRNVIKIPTLPDSMQHVPDQVQHQTQSQSQSQEIICNPSCSEHGACVDVNKCHCEDGWTGDVCDTYYCVDECHNGICSGPNTCTCQEGWEGDVCDKAICQTSCMNGGSCASPDKCHCVEGWSGSHCGTPTCGKGCQNNATCTAPNVCTCLEGYKGDFCEIPLPKDCVFPFEFNGKLYEDCTNDGSTDGEYWCSTSTIYQGDRRKCTGGSAGEEGGDSGSEVGYEPLKGSTCAVWKAEHYHTFDGLFYSSTGQCHYYVVKDCKSDSFSISVIYNDNGKAVLRISNYDMKIELSQGNATFDDAQIQIPSFNNGVHIERIPHTDYVVLYGQLFGLDIVWDGDSSFFIHVSNSEKWAGNLCGLCGNFNGEILDDMTPKGLDAPITDVATVMDSWQVREESTSCSTPDVTHYCSGLSTQEIEDAAKLCMELKQEDTFDSCSGYVSDATFNELCLMSVCQCRSDYSGCICSALTQYSRLCVARGAKMDNWRSDQYCAKQCSGGRVYQECGSPCPRTCRNRYQQMTCAMRCVDGCFCPTGMVLDGDVCVAEDRCSCVHNGESFSSGEVRSTACEECTCSDGAWNCKNFPCVGECAITGDPHFRTFDGKTYNFDGKCQYVLATDGCGANEFTFAITSENVACGVGGFCTKSVVLVTNGPLGQYKYKLGEDESVFVNDVSVKLPYSHGDISIEKLSNLVIRIKTAQGIEVEWDGKMRVYVRVDPSWSNKVCGMCGNFNAKSTDDFSTPQGTLVPSATIFGNSWRINGECPDASPVLPDSCKSSKEQDSFSELMCSVIKGAAFATCHSVVDWNLYYHNCRDDACRCYGSTEGCACDAVADYARECSKNGVVAQWRNVTYCPVTCEGGQVYKECGSLCETTCGALGDASVSCDTCSPGCFCPEGTYLSQDNKCVSVDKCQCSYHGKVYAPGDKLDTGGVSCQCENGKMHCVNSTHQYSCDSNFEYFDCRTATSPSSKGLACKYTCANPTNALCEAQVSQCISGCTCPAGFVLDEHTHTCLTLDKCTCAFNGKTFMPGETRQEQCNTCQCTDGRWSCTEKACSAECSAVGDPHYTTFDGLTYNFQGSCSYTLAQDICHGEKSGSFRVVVENIPCGNTDVTCTKSVDVHFHQHSVHFTKGDGEPVASYSNATNAALDRPVSFHIRKGSIYYILETDIGLSVLWNGNNIVKVQLDPQHSGKVCGLCGNFDYDQNNDLQTSDGDIVGDPNTFGNDWKLIETCPITNQEPNPCTENPHREHWAKEKCGIIMSDVFADCHDRVDPTTYYDNCLYDTCGCDFGGDCECFCTAVAAYAQACAANDVCVVWRGMDVCPIMCEAYDPGYDTGNGDYECEWKYETCGNPCPPTCWDRNPSCPWKKLEGCYVPCKDDEVWDYDQQKCVHESSCPVIPDTTTPAPPTTTPETTTPEPTTTTPEPEQCICRTSDGDEYLPGDSWPMRNDPTLCVQMTCVEESPGVCITKSNDYKQTCDSQPMPSCANGFYPVAIDDGCTCQWECRCYCFGQGDPHFFTFDGFYYPFQGNCTFVLARDSGSKSATSTAVAETRHKIRYDYQVWIQNVQCQEAPTTTCTRMVTVKFNDTTIQLINDYTFTVNGGPPADGISNLPAEINGIAIQLRGTTLFEVNIEAIGLRLTYTGEDYSWGLELPWGYASDNTEGLCGICNNNQGDDLTTSKGEITTDLEEFGYSWLITRKSSACYEPPPICPDPPAPECDVITSPIFEACHSLVDPRIFRYICQFDTKCGKYSHCKAIFGYARLCQVAGVCIDWRGSDLCPIDCLPDRVYEACRPNCDDTCDNFHAGTTCMDDALAEGCFCPEHTVLVDGECLSNKTCTNCVDDNGDIFELGESFIPPGDTCSICTCMEGQKFACNPLACPAGWSPDRPSCGACEIPQQVPGSDPCCPVYECVCNYPSGHGTDGCPTVQMPTCPEAGSVSNSVGDQCVPEYQCVCDTDSKPCPPPPTCSDIEYLHTEDGDCCPKYECRCKKCHHDNLYCSICEDTVIAHDACECKHTSCKPKGVCVYNRTLYEPGDDFWIDPCQHCTCQESELNDRGCYHADCYFTSCATYCPPCQQYIITPGECCGTCVQTQCVVEDEHGDQQCVPVGTNWEDRTECSTYTCVTGKDGVPITNPTPISCDPLIMPSCGPCYEPLITTENCCDVAQCVKSDVCCSLDGTTVKQPGEDWQPNNCETCSCTGKLNKTSGFNIVECNHKPCENIDESQCPGVIVPTEDGCCKKCDDQCIASDGNSHKVGESWYNNTCTICSCATGNEIKCNGIACSSDTAGKVPHCGKCEVVTRIPESDPCCPEYQCVCNYETGKGSDNCPAITVPNCDAGFVPVNTNSDACVPHYECECHPDRNACPPEPVCDSLHHLVTTETECCPHYGCVCNKCDESPVSCSPCESVDVTNDACDCRHVSCIPKGVCHFNNTDYNVGQYFKKNVCTECECLGKEQDDSNCLNYQCETETCNTDCPPCYDYNVPSGQCCGTCTPTGCPYEDDDGSQTCKGIGDNWEDIETCSVYFCVLHAKPTIVHRPFECPSEKIPICSSCYRLDKYTEDCCTKYRCVPDNVCCDNGLPMPPSATWNPDQCTTCGCSKDIDEETGFHVQKCVRKPCPPVDKVACLSKGGHITGTEDGCCEKCQIDACFECSRHIASHMEYVRFDKCVSVHKQPVSYCDGFCRSGSLWSAVGFKDSCSCCKPSSYKQSVIDMKCSDGEEMEYEWSSVDSCSCSGSCECEATPPPTPEESGSGEGSTPEPEESRPTPEPEESGSTSEESGSTSEESGSTSEESGSTPEFVPELSTTQKPPLKTTTMTTTSTTTTTTTQEPTTPMSSTSTTLKSTTTTGTTTTPEPTTTTTITKPTTTTEATTTTFEPTTITTTTTPEPTTTTATTTTTTLEQTTTASTTTTTPEATATTTTTTTPEPTTTSTTTTTPEPTTTSTTTTPKPTTTSTTTTTTTTPEQTTTTTTTPEPTTTSTTTATTTTPEPTTTSTTTTTTTPEPTTTEATTTTTKATTTTTTTPEPTTTIATTTPESTTTEATTTTTTTTTTLEPTTTSTTTPELTTVSSTTVPTTTTTTTTSTTLEPTTTSSTTTEETEPTTTTKKATTSVKTTTKPTPSTTTETTTLKQTTTSTTEKPTPGSTTTDKETTLTTTTPPPKVEPTCSWSDWISSDRPKLPQTDDDESYDHIRLAGHSICENPTNIECRPLGSTTQEFKEMQEWQKVTCDVKVGLQCFGNDQPYHPVCEDYEIRVYCCDDAPSTGGDGQQQQQNQNQNQGGTGGQSQHQSQGQSQSQEVSDITSNAQSIIENLEDNGGSVSFPDTSVEGQGDIQVQHQSQSQGQGQTQGQSQVQHQSQSQGQSQGQVQTQHQSQSQGQGQSQGQSQAQHQSQSQGQSQGHVQTQHQSQSQGQDQSQGQTQVQHQSQSQHQSQGQSQTQHQSQSQGHSQGQQQVQHQQQSQAQRGQSQSQHQSQSQGNWEHNWQAIANANQDTINAMGTGDIQQLLDSIYGGSMNFHGQHQEQVQHAMDRLGESEVEQELEEELEKRLSGKASSPVKSSKSSKSKSEKSPKSKSEKSPKSKSEKSPKSKSEKSPKSKSGKSPKSHSKRGFDNELPREIMDLISKA